MFPWWLAGCTVLEPVLEPVIEPKPAPAPATETPADTDTDVVDRSPPPPGTWTVHDHPCRGHRTDTMLVEPDVVWVGCGTNADGRGLYRSVDDGVSWEGVPALRDWRVNDLFRGTDGLLYIAGIDRSGHGRGAVLDGKDVLNELLVSTGQLWNSMNTGSVRRTPKGDIVFESLPGTNAAYRAAGDAIFSDATEWWTRGGSKQILDLEVVAEDFYGCGSTIANPPVVFLPPKNGRRRFQMTPVELRDDFDGELWDIHVQDGQIVVAGVDQDADVGVVFVSGDDPFEASSWRQFRAEAFYPSQSTWFRGVCRGKGTIYAVGELSSSGRGIVLASDDAGDSWYPIQLPNRTGAVHVCHVDDAGTVHVAGAAGFYGRYAP